MKSREVGAELLVDLADNLTMILTDKLGIDPNKAKRAAQDAAAHIADNWGGQSVYIPMDLVTRMNTRNSDIYSEFSGDNISELVRKFGLSRQAIYRIIRVERQRRLPRQGSLFQNM
ncbi:DNA-binding protein [Pseudodesulfovibrio sp. JC047]|uniref:Mor transcription activator family protein n=1 Tax=Pseudodesulfovibrio sp. JC047 TaxID=2683199 RepID=UPI0013D7645C|nr:Mor transcription activator family protein [Pseudodesulfovibrio sp. JC047]NDV21022.1 DNA-binding protein [Pseudodesulfovibrio sp. JC047]